MSKKTYSEISDTNDEEVKDPWCDPENPRKIRFEDITAAAYRIRDGIIRTTCQQSHMNQEVGMNMYFKNDFMQSTGSFKERGARYTLINLPKEQKSVGVVAASAGNHAQALAYHGRDLGIPVTVVMPIVAPIMKVEKCKRYGANVIVKGNDLGDSKYHALKLAKKHNLTYINGYDHPDILAGQGTMGLEILDQVPNLDAIVIPVGGGGLIAGCALAIKTMKPDVKVIGVEPELCKSFSTAIRAGKPVPAVTKASLADGLTVPTVGVNAFATGAPIIDKIVSVSEAWIAIAILRLIENEKAVVEGAGAVGLAAVLAGLLPELKGKTIVLPLCGGNIDTTLLGRCLERGLAAEGRLITFSVTVSDRPGGIAELSKLIANVGVTVKDIVHERAWVRQNTFSVGVRILAETRNRKHSRELFKLLKENYEEVTVHGFYESPQDYVSGNLNSEKFDRIDDETPYEGAMNKQYNLDMESSEESSHEDEMEDMNNTKEHVQDLESSEESSHEDESEDNESSADSGTSTLALDGASVDDLKKLLLKANLNKGTDNSKKKVKL